MLNTCSTKKQGSVPHPLGELVLVDQPQVLAVEHEAGIGLGCRERSPIPVQAHFGGRKAARGGGLADCLRPGDQDGSVGAQTRPQAGNSRSELVPPDLHGGFPEAALRLDGQPRQFPS